MIIELKSLEEQTYNDFLKQLIDLLDVHRSDRHTAFMILIYIQRLSSECRIINLVLPVVLRIPKPLLSELCRICSLILKDPNQSRDSLFTITLSVVSLLIQLSDNMEWFVCNGLIEQLSILFQRDCTFSMCRLFIIILNQLVANGNSSPFQITCRSLSHQTLYIHRYSHYSEVYSLVYR